MGREKQSKTEKTRSNGKLDDGVREARKMQMIKRKTWMTSRREKWLVGLGVILHAVYMLSIFDIYFKSPIVHGMDPVKPRFSPPAKRLVLIIGDGLRADKFYELDEKGNTRAPFLRSVIKQRGRWGVSHARPPTESRPGHVSILAGFYEDPSAVTKGWKDNPVEYDSVLNRSHHIFSYGSPTVVPLFCGALPHCTWNSYPHEFEDYATEGSFLDEWSFDEFQSLLNRSKEDQKLQQLLHQDNIVVFLHLMGCDINGHSHRPFSSTYLNNIKVLDEIAQKVYNLMEGYFKDNQTAYIFTADHGMSDKGSHGDGHPTCTNTPLVAWGAGVKSSKPASKNQSHGIPTPNEWGLDGIERVDVNQADISPLMSTLLGQPYPVNSVGILPLDYVDLAESEQVEAVLANAKQILNQFLRKSYIKQSNSFFFKPFEPLANYSSVLDKIEELISTKDYQSAMKLSENLRKLALDGLHYFQTYDWMMLKTIVTLGYIGWIVYLVIHVLQSYTSLPDKIMREEQAVQLENKPRKVYILGSLFVGAFSILLYIGHSPPLYHAYMIMTVFLWTQILSEYQFLNALWKMLQKEKLGYIIKLLVYCVMSLLVAEFLVHSFTERRLYTSCFLIIGVVAPLYLYHAIPWRSWIPPFIWASCWCLSIFTLMPAEIPDDTLLVIGSGALIILIGVAARLLELYAQESKYWQTMINHELSKPKLPMLFHLQAVLVGLSSIMVWVSTSRRARKQQLLVLHQLMNWFIAGFSMGLPLFSAPSLSSRLTSIFLGFAPAFLLLSIGYEALFYTALGLVLMAWILFENTMFYLNKVEKSSASLNTVDKNITVEQDRFLELSDVRISLVFMVLFFVAFFGTGNFASIASFEISSVYRFVTVFSPFLMAALLILKLLIPFILVICAFGAIIKLIRVPRLGLYFLAIVFSDVMTIHFFFVVQNTGSWMEIGNSISHFGIVSAQVVFILVLFALSNMYTKDIQIGSSLLRKQQ